MPRDRSASLVELIEEAVGGCPHGGDISGGHAAVERLLHGSTDALPLLTADETNALAEQLTEHVSRVVVDGLHVLVRVLEDDTDVLGLGDDTVHFHVSGQLLITASFDWIKTYTSGVMPDQRR